MRKTCVIAICLGFFLQAGANTGIVCAALLKDTSLRNNQVAALPSPPASDLTKDIHETNLSHALPLSLDLFKVALNYDRVFILWSTGQEPNIKYFTVERSTDGINYNFLGFLVASNQSEKNDYRLIDNTPADGINYYRLSQTDLNGKTRYYGNRIINKNGNDFSAGIINFSNGNIKMIINSSKNDDLSLDLVDISGNKIKQETFAVATGSTSKTILLPKGTYVAMLSNRAGERSVNKIVVQ